MIWPLPLQIARGQRSQLVIDERHEAVQRLSVPLTPLEEKSSALGGTGIVHHDDYREFLPDQASFIGVPSSEEDGNESENAFESRHHEIFHGGKNSCINGRGST